MRLLPSLATLLLASTISLPALASDAVGVRETTIHSTTRDKDLAVTVWYPSKTDGTETPVGDNRIFKGATALKDASIADGHHPLILLSHGSGSRVEGMVWIATKLAEAGFIVAGPNHPGTTSGDSTPAETPKIWERTNDLSTIITAMTEDAAWQGSIDKGHIGVLGFSLGGSTAMEIVGGRANLDAYVKYCEDYPGMMDCRWFAGGRGYINEEAVDVEKLDLRKLDKARFEQSNRDPRITSAVLVDPGLAVAFKPESLKDIDIPVQFINLGSTGKIPVAVLADTLSKQVPTATYVQVNGSDHFSFLPQCKPGAADFLKSVGERDPICDEAGLRPRADIHAQLENLIVDAFTRTLKASQ
jgi:predicted dienelactone hydrolase